nr:MAG TPA: hypothetical protein [Caudoviricetes sp.]
MCLSTIQKCNVYLCRFYIFYLKNSSYCFNIDTRFTNNF